MARRHYSQCVFPAFTSSDRRTVTPWSPRKEPNFSYRLMRAIYPAFRLFPNQIIRADNLAKVMVDVGIKGTAERGGPVFENRDIRSMVEPLRPPAVRG